VSIIVVGVDGGGSKTRVVVADEQGREIVGVDGPASAVRPGHVDLSADVIAACVRDALAAANMTHVVPKVLCVGVAGVGREPEREALWQGLVARELAEDVVVHTDAAIALDDAFGDGAGILLVSGTGSVAFARGPDGTFARCGGWGPVIGDEGSGAWIGRRALNIAAAAADGREPETALVNALLTAIEADDPSAIVPWAAQATPAQFARLAPVVLQVAATGDLRANSLLSMAVEELVLHVRTLARRLFVDERAAAGVALAGGLLTRGAPLRKRLEHRLKTAVPGAQVRAADVEPARGAVRAAMRFLGVEMAETR
jgi:glucosamine kinase